MKVVFVPKFIRRFNKLEQGLQEEVIDAVEKFKDERNHKKLRVHKLKGRLRGRYSFSVNYKTRIVFRYFSKDEAVFLDVGDHDIYK